MYIYKVCLVYKFKNKLLVFINYINFIIEREKIEWNEWKCINFKFCKLIDISLI